MATVTTTESWFVPDMPLPPGVRALQTTRQGGVSSPPWDSFNLGDHVADSAADVAANRARLAAVLPSEPRWLKQVHGTTVLQADHLPSVRSSPPEADAVVASKLGVVCTIMTADCLPVLFCSRDGQVVAAAHAGWRGLCAGVLEASIRQMQVPAASIMAWLGPAIGPRSFEVGPEVREAFLAQGAEAAAAFVPAVGDRWLADIYTLARQRLQRAGVAQIHGGGACTVTEADRYFSYRRDGVTGRMASLIWRES
ncbi:MAG: peptidoglycan editing factor PgeF [Zoogloeaceae bacterium]|nr:peptidoglycan editing factor PgeF [Zoogloeaceae bacterium]